MIPHPPPVASASADHSLNSWWQAEAVRLRELRSGPLDDTEAVRIASIRHKAPTDRLLARARHLAERDGLAASIAGWRNNARFLVLLLATTAILAGIGAAATALGAGTRSVNLLWALGSLLALPSLTLLLWLASLAASHRTNAILPGRIWLWCARKLARAPARLLTLNALVSLLSRHGLLRWLLGTLSHAWWLLMLITTCCALLVMLSLRRYGFAWETTLLTPDAFVSLLQTLGKATGLLGLPAPDAAVIRASHDAAALPADAHAQWSRWLLGAVLVYGLLPRIPALLFCLLRLQHGLSRLSPAWQLPGWASLETRLQYRAPPPVIDAPAPDQDPVRMLADVHAAPSPRLTLAPDSRILAGLELPDDLPWPPSPMPANVTDAGIADSRAQRHALLDALSRQPAARLLLCCDPRQTPDRGLMHLIAELSRQAGQTRLLFCAPQHNSAFPETMDTRYTALPRLAAWHDRLADAGLQSLLVAPGPADADTLRKVLDWLGATDMDSHR